MADNLTTQSATPATVPASTVIATDDVGGVHYQLVKLAFGALDTATLVATGAGLPISDAGGSLTVDAPAGAPVFMRLSDGTSAITTLPVSLSSLPALAAGTNLIGQTAAGLQTNRVLDGTTALTPKFASIDIAASGDTTEVALVVGKKIRVLAYRFVSAGAVSVRFKSGASTNLTGAMSTGAAGGGGGAAFNPIGHFETASGEALVMNLSAAVQVSGHLCYVEV